jgi:hypothetical protein
MEAARVAEAEVKAAATELKGVVATEPQEADGLRIRLQTEPEIKRHGRGNPRNRALVHEGLLLRVLTLDSGVT